MKQYLNATSTRSLAGRLIQQDAASLALAAVDRQLSAQPEMRKRFAGKLYAECVRDTQRPLTALAQALLAEEPALFESYVIWARIALCNLGFPDEYLFASLVAIRETLVLRLTGPVAEVAAEYIDSSLATLSAVAAELPDGSREVAPLAGAATDYLDALLAGDRTAALGVVRDAVEAGAILPDIYDHVFRAAQHEVGRRWQTNQLSVAMEHYTTGATEAIMSQLSSAGGGPRVRRFLGACVDGEQHDLAIRMVCDLLEAEGWDTVFLGANTPEAELVRAVEEFRPAVVGLSATWLFRVDNVSRLIARIRDADPRVKVVVGGAPFDRSAGLADAVGADARGASLLTLPALLGRLTEEN